MVHHGNGRGAEERQRVVPNAQGMDNGPIIDFLLLSRSRRLTEEEEEE
jgi:hypothetical protein